jgi:hypothetical protein
MKNQTLITLVCVISFLLQFDLLSAQPKLEFSHEHGFYKSSFQLSIKSSDPEAIIKYTLDGSDPKNSSIAQRLNSPAEITVNPYLNNGRAVTPGVIVRACAIEGSDTSKTYTKSYIFLSEVKFQKDVSPELLPYWPDQRYMPTAKYSPNLLDWMKYGNDTSGFQYINLGVSSTVVDREEYYSGFENDLLSIPTFSLVTDPANLFDQQTGIYINGTWGGKAWERPASVELIDPLAGGFQANTGIRIRGGFSSSGGNPKHAFRLYFREEYGDSKLKYPLFGTDGVDEFDKIDLRCDQNNSWNEGNPGADYIHDAFSRDIQGEMNQPYTRSRYYHLYLNGMYWGLFETQERASANFAESYIGGNEEDYDVVKSSAGAIDYPTYTLEATDGDLNSSKALWNIAMEGFSHENYFKAQGLNPDGTVNPAYPKFLDVDNLISYIMIIYFSANTDGPASLDPNDHRINNFFGIFNHKNPDGFKYCIHDNETAYNTVSDSIVFAPTPPGVGAGWEFESFNPMWLHQRLIGNPDYKQRFADLAYRFLCNDGVLSPEKNIARFQKRIEWISGAIVGESARWGNLGGGRPNTKNNTWLPVVNRMIQTYFPQRSQIVLRQFKSIGWINKLVPPSFDESQFTISEKGFINKDGHFKLINSSPWGQIYYTTDNSDPRSSGGKIAKSAIAYSSEIDASKTVFLKARIKEADLWSPLMERVILNNDGSKLVISEISYNPPSQIIGNDTLTSKKLEFIEIKNFSNSDIELSGYEINGGIIYHFPSGSVINANSLIVIASDPASFLKLYGFSPFGQFSGNLKNQDESFNLINACGSVIAKVSYNSSEIWYNATDGAGYTLVASSYFINQIYDIKPSWRISTNWLGSPGADDPAGTDAIITISEVLANSKKPLVDAIEFYNPNNFQVNIGNWFISDEKDQPRKWKIPAGTIIQPLGYLSYNEGHYVSDTLQFSSNEFGSAFSLSKGGEKIYIYSGDNDEKLKSFIYEYEFGATDPNTSYGKFISYSGNEHDIQLQTCSFGEKNGDAKSSPIIFKTIMYHPINENFEFITLKNRSDSTVNLFCDQYPEETWKVEGIDFNFPKGVSLAAGDSLFLVEKLLPSEIFCSMMKLPANVKVFNYEGKLKNSGEAVSIKKPLPVENDSTVEFSYINLEEVQFNDKSPWPQNADGQGFALLRKDDNTFGNDASNWTSVYRAVPYAIAGNNTRIRLNSTFSLDGSGSHDPLNLPLTYEWKLISKPENSNTQLSDVHSATPKIIPDREGNYMISLKVSNGSVTSAPSFVSLYAYPNSAPVTDSYIRAYRITLNQSVLLNTSDCIDPDYEELSFEWGLAEKPAGSTYLLENINTESFNFTPDMVGNYRFTLNSTDGQYSGTSVSIRIIVSPATGNEMVSAIDDFNVYPNPVDNEAYIEFNLKKSSPVNVTITNLQGRKIISRNYGTIEPGNQIITTRFSDFSIPGGIYLINLRTSEYSLNKKVSYIPGN